MGGQRNDLLMKSFAILLFAALGLFFAQSGHAQYKGSRDYFPKSFPPPPTGGSSPAGTNSPARQRPATPQQPRFKDLPLTTGFYFLSDTNRTYLWTKTSVSSAKNTKNGVVQTISGETPVQK